ncbi:MAG TPA: hypothetical protein VFB80_18920, partial [Pirellulaceae bacterium]|nr:hypothetical protein [Pirellulaceae bacterium]
VAKTPADRLSLLLVEEYFDAEDERFLAALRQQYPPAALAAFADRWKKDTRPWARRQIFLYLSMPLDVPAHHPVVKRLFKHAEQTGDHELMGAFLHTFDCLVRKYRKKLKRWDWDPQTRRSSATEEEVLKLPTNVLAPWKVQEYRNPRTGQKIEYPDHRAQARRGAVLFSYATRRYLRRRAWRYFRHLAHQDPLKYLVAITLALGRYEDKELAHGEDLLESWGLMHACFHGHDALEFKPIGVKLRPGRSLSELSPAPYRPELWKTEVAFPVLLGAMIGDGSRCIRTWCRQLLEREHATRLQSISAELLLMLLDSSDEEVQQFGARLLGSLDSAGHWPVETWLRLLETKDPAAIALICEAMQKHVRGDRLDLAQCLAMATARATPVAKLGLTLLQQRKFAAAERGQLTLIGNARCAAIGAELATWTLGIVGAAAAYDRDVVLALFDSLLKEVRTAAWDWLRAGPAIPADPQLWCRLLETPYDDLKLALVDHLQSRSALPGTSTSDLAPIWSAVLAGVHRGGRQKLKAIDQLAAAVCRDPEQAGDLVPVLALAVRSIRKPEARAALAAVARIVGSRPELEPLVAAKLPELSLTAPAALPTV